MHAYEGPGLLMVHTENDLFEAPDFDDNRILLCPSYLANVFRFVMSLQPKSLKLLERSVS